MKSLTRSIIYILLLLISTPALAEVSEDILLKCTYERITSNNYPLSKFAPKVFTVIYYLDPAGRNFYNASKERIEASIDDLKIMFNLSTREETTSVNIDRLSGFFHLNKIITRDEMIKLNPLYNQGDYVETFEGGCVQSNEKTQF